MEKKEQGLKTDYSLICEQIIDDLLNRGLIPNSNENISRLKRHLFIANKFPSDLNFSDKERLLDVIRMFKEIKDLNSFINFLNSENRATLNNLSIAFYISSGLNKNGVYLFNEKNEFLTYVYKNTSYRTNVFLSNIINLILKSRIEITQLNNQYIKYLILSGVNFEIELEKIQKDFNNLEEFLVKEKKVLAFKVTHLMRVFSKLRQEPINENDAAFNVNASFSFFTEDRTIISSFKNSILFDIQIFDLIGVNFEKSTYLFKEDEENSIFVNNKYLISIKESNKKEKILYITKNIERFFRVKNFGYTFLENRSSVIYWSPLDKKQEESINHNINFLAEQFLENKNLKLKKFKLEVLNKLIKLNSFLLNSKELNNKKKGMEHLNLPFGFFKLKEFSTQGINKENMINEFHVDFSSIGKDTVRITALTKTLFEDFFQSLLYNLKISIPYEKLKFKNKTYLIPEVDDIVQLMYPDKICNTAEVGKDYLLTEIIQFYKSKKAVVKELEEGLNNEFLVNYSLLKVVKKNENQSKNTRAKSSPKSQELKAMLGEEALGAFQRAIAEFEAGQNAPGPDFQ